MTRVLIVEDHAVFRAGLRALLATAPEFELVGETDSGREAVRLASELAPDLIVMDLQLPDMNGVEATSLITRDAPGARVLVLTMYDDDRSVFEAIRAGALGYALKGSAPEALLRAMQAVADGEASFSAAIATRIQRYFAARVAGEGILFEELTEREHEVLAAVAEGLPNAEIARRLGLRPKTVRNHVSNVVAKLQVANRHEAAARARERGM